MANEYVKMNLTEIVRETKKVKSSSERTKKIKESSDENKNNFHRLSKSNGCLSKDKSSEAEAQKMKKLIPSEDSKMCTTMKRHLERSEDKKHKSHKRYRSSSSSSAMSCSSNRELHSTPRQSISRESDIKESRRAESSSNCEGVTSELKGKKKSPITSLSNKSKGDTGKQPTPIGSCKNRRISRLNSERDCARQISKEMREKLNRIKLQDNDKLKGRRSKNRAFSKLHRDEGLQVAVHEKITHQSAASIQNLKKKSFQTNNTVKKPQENIVGFNTEEKTINSAKKMITQEPPSKAQQSVCSSSHIRKDYLGRKLAKFARDEKEKEKQILSELPKSASAVQRKKKALTLPATNLACNEAPDILKINASVPIDTHLFEDIERRPLPSVPILQETVQQRIDETPLIGRAFIPSSIYSTDINCFNQKEFDESHSPNSVDTVILEISSTKQSNADSSSANGESKDIMCTVGEDIIADRFTQTSTHIKLDKLDPRGCNRTSSFEQISHLENQQIEFDKILKELEVSQAPKIIGDKVQTNAIHNNSEIFLNKFITKNSKDIDKELESPDAFSFGEIKSTVKQKFLPVLKKSQSVMPIILMQFPMILIDQPILLQNKENEIEKLYIDVINLIRVTKYHRKMMKIKNTIELEPQVRSLCEASIKVFKVLKQQEEIKTNEKMIELIVNKSSTLITPWRIKVEDVLWVLENSSANKLDCIPVPTPNNRYVNNKSISNYKLISGEKQSLTNSAFHSSRNVTSTMSDLINAQVPKLRDSKLLVNGQSCKSNQTQLNTMNKSAINGLQHLFTSQTNQFKRTPPNYTPSYTIGDSIVQKEKQLIAINSSIQQQMQTIQAMENSRLPALSSRSYPEELLLPQSQDNVPPHSDQSYSIPLFDQHKVIPLDQVMTNPIGNLPNPDIIPYELKKCFSGHCKHPNCPRFLKVQNFQLSRSRANEQQISQILSPQVTGLQAELNRDSRLKGAKLAQQHMHPMTHYDNASIQQQRSLFSQEISSIKNFECIRNQGNLVEQRDGEFSQYLANSQLQQVTAAAKQAGGQMNILQNNKDCEKQLSSRVCSNSIRQPPCFGITRELPICLEKSINTDNTLNQCLSNSRECATPSLSAGTSSKADINYSNMIFHDREGNQQRDIDVIPIDSSSEDEVFEISYPSKFSQVNDEIECVKRTKELGIKFNNNESELSPELSPRANENLPIIGQVMTIPMTAFEEMSADINEPKIKNDSPHQGISKIIEEKTKFCIICDKKVAVFCCSNCHVELFCSRFCANVSDHFMSPSCMPVVKIEDD